jgi:hypothetical protein
VGVSLETRRAVFDPETGKYVEPADPSGQVVSGGSSGTTVDPKVKPMESNEWQLGIERALSESVHADLTYIHRHTIHAWEDNEINLIWNRAGTNVIGSRDGTGQQVFHLTSLDEAERTYDAFQLSFEKRFEDHWTLNGSYTLSWLRGTTSELLTRAFDNPRQDVYLDGYLPNDHRHVIKLQGVYKWDFGLSLGGSYLFETGGPYDRLYLNDFDSDYTNRHAPRGRNPGDDPNDPSDDKPLRLPDYTQLDLRVAYDFKPLLDQDLELIVDIFNVLNLSTPTAVNENQTADGGFGLPSDRQAPFQAQVAIRYQY